MIEQLSLSIAVVRVCLNSYFELLLSVFAYLLTF